MQNIGELLDARAAEHANRPALYFYEDVYTYAQLDEQVNRAAGALRDHGIGKGDVVALMLPNCPEFLFAMFGAQKLGAAVTPINVQFQTEETRYQLEDSGARVLVTAPPFLPIVEAIQASLPALETVLLAGEQVPGHVSLAEAMRAASPKLPAVEIDPPDVALIIYTSGATGLPKGVMLSHGNVLANTSQIAATALAGPDDRVMLILPLFHVNGIIATTMEPLFVGASIVMRRRFVLDEFWPAIERYRVTLFSAVPTVYAMLLAAPDDERHDTSSLRFGVCGAAPMPPEVYRRFEQRFGVKIAEGYGLSEATCVSSLNPVDGRERKIGSVGLPLPGQEICVVDDAGRALEPGAAGEVVVRGANVMPGYLRNSEATAEAMRGGWLRTGDIGYLDSDGYLYLVDRKKDMIIRGGENVYPKEVENVLYQHPAVLEAAVVGIPDSVMGEQVKAYIVLRPGQTVAAEDFLLFCARHLARYKTPKEVAFLPSLPKNAVGKVTKGPLREMARGQ